MEREDEGHKNYLRIIMVMGMKIVVMIMMMVMMVMMMYDDDDHGDGDLGREMRVFGRSVTSAATSQITDLGTCCDIIAVVIVEVFLKL